MRDLRSFLHALVEAGDGDALRELRCAIVEAESAVSVRAKAASLESVDGYYAAEVRQLRCLAGVYVAEMDARLGRLTVDVTPPAQVQTKVRKISAAKRDEAIRHITRILDAVGRDGAMALLGVDEDTLRRAGVGQVVLEGAAELARRCEAGEVGDVVRVVRRARLDSYSVARGEGVVA